MNSLTPTEVTALNNISFEHYPAVPLGTILDQIVDAIPGTGTPVNAVEAKMDLTLTGVVIDGETVTVDNPAVGGTNVYEFVADAAKTTTLPTNLPVDIAASTTQSTINLAIPTQPTAGDTMTIGTRVYTFVPNGTDNADREISVGSSLATAQAAIKAAVNGTDDHNVAHPDVTLGDFNANVAAVTAKVGGVAGDNIVTTETFTAVGNVFSGVKLAGGADCSAANAITALVAAITASDTQGVAASDEAGDVVRLTADVAGIAGNNIVIGETLANGAFTGGATALAGGVNGTVGVMEKPLIDASYLYICVAANTVSGKNWRRISLGAAY